jgi:GNAT superfamily N-acetyltransferase
MRIVDLDDTLREDYLTCLEPWSDEAMEGRARKAAWLDKMQSRGLVVKLAVDDDGRAIGMIHAVPVEETPHQGEGLYFVLCIWVHGHPQGVGNQGHGVGTALLEALEAAVRARGAEGIAAWGLALPVWMRARWFRRRGYRRRPARALGALVEAVRRPRPPAAVRPPRSPARCHRRAGRAGGHQPHQRVVQRHQRGVRAGLPGLPPASTSTTSHSPAGSAQNTRTGTARWGRIWTGTAPASASGASRALCPRPTLHRTSSATGFRSGGSLPATAGSRSRRRTAHRVRSRTT